MNNKENNKREKEKFYFASLKPYYKEKFEHFEQGERPDFQNDIDGIGLEITTPGDNETGKRYSFYDRALSCQNKEEVEKQSDDCYNGKFKDEISYVKGKPCSWWNVEWNKNDPLDENLLCKAIKNKIQKLQKYRKFQTNTLLLYCHHVYLKPIYDSNKFSNIINKIKELEKFYKCKYDEYIMLSPTDPTIQLYIIRANYELEECCYHLEK